MCIVNILDGTRRASGWARKGGEGRQTAPAPSESLLNARHELTKATGGSFGGAGVTIFVAQLLYAVVWRFEAILLGLLGWFQF